jgi:hypothetical protein
MRSRAALLLVLCATLFAIPAPASAGFNSVGNPALRGAGTPPDYQPDARIKLCGLSTGCTIDPLPHPWHGNDVYNTTGAKQKVSVRIDDGEGVRFWILLQNDGALDDTFTLHGCKGNPRFRINAVLIGKIKAPGYGPTVITQEFKRGTYTFDFPGGSMKKNVALTLNIVTKTPGLRYRCPITVISRGLPSVKDTVVAIMTTY